MRKISGAHSPLGEQRSLPMHILCEHKNASNLVELANRISDHIHNGAAKPSLDAAEMAAILWASLLVQDENAKYKIVRKTS